MRSYPNPFRVRASEQFRDSRGFLRSFGPGIVEMLPENIWDRLFVLRSAPGGGKTSLMRLFTAESLRIVHDRQDDFQELSRGLTDLNALGPDGPLVVGLLLNLERDYRGISDVGATPRDALRLFLRLLDVRIAVGFLRAVATHAGLPPEMIGDGSMKLTCDDPAVAEAARRIGGLEPAGILSHARLVEERMLYILDALRPVTWSDEEVGHSDLYSLRVLSACKTEIAGQRRALRPLVMLDDGHRLARDQRVALLGILANRTLGVARWYSERYEALSAQELMATAGQRGRDYELLELEAAARGDVPYVRGNRWRPGRFERILHDVGNRRAARVLTRYEETDDFTDLLEFPPDELLAGKQPLIRETLLERLDRATRLESRYEQWRQRAETLSGYEGMVRLAELIILVARDRHRSQGELFEEVLDPALVEERGSSALREAAALDLAIQFDLPYYAGPETLAKLGSHNVEQYLDVAGDMFEEMLAALTLARTPRISAYRQDRIVRRASERLWREIPRRIPHGRDVQAIVAGIVEISESERKERVPYPPGVTGTALTMAARQQLIDRTGPASSEVGERLLHALGEAVAHNVLSAEVDRSVKGGRFMVIYLNRLLCPRFNLPLGRGAFREKPLSVFGRWLPLPSSGTLGLRTTASAGELPI